MDAALCSVQSEAMIGGSAKQIPLRILLVDDSSTQRMVALMQLEHLGYQADVAENGLEALAAVREKTYDVVLMDIKMPEMGGLEATGRIRALGEGIVQPRIIALTAEEAAEGGADEHRSAGLDGRLSKPVQSAELAAALAAVGCLGNGGEPVAAWSAAARSPAAPAEPGQLSSAALANLADLVQEDPEHLSELVERFVSRGAPRLLAQMGAALDGDDRPTLARAAHTLKANAATFGAHELQQACYELELLAESASPAMAQAALGVVEAEAARALPAISDWAARVLGQPPAGPAAGDE